MGTKNNATFINILSSIAPGFASVGNPANVVIRPARKIPTPDTAFAENLELKKKYLLNVFWLLTLNLQQYPTP